MGPSYVTINQLVKYLNAKIVKLQRFYVPVKKEIVIISNFRSPVKVNIR